MKNKISPSIMCADFMHLDRCIAEFEKCGIELIHVDIMDGSFVPNFTLGTDFVKRLKASTKIPLDIHLMVDRPENKLGWFGFGEDDCVSVHLESTQHINKVIGEIKSRGAKPMIAINPGTPLCLADEVLDDIDAVLVMTVNPGFAGQKLVRSTLDKISRLRKLLDSTGRENVEIEVDGNVSFENAKLMCGAGANIFVAGTSSVFAKDGSMCENIENLRKMLRQGRVELPLPK